MGPGFLDHDAMRGCIFQDRFCFDKSLDIQRSLVAVYARAGSAGQFMQRVMQETSFGCLLPHFLQFGEPLHLEVV